MTIRVLEAVRDALKACNVIDNEREFCEGWLGKSECYLRTLRFNQLQPSADAMMTCASKLGWYAEQMRTSGKSHHIHWAVVFGELREDCVTAVERAAYAKWQRVSLNNEKSCSR